MLRSALLRSLASPARWRSTVAAIEKVAPLPLQKKRVPSAYLLYSAEMREKMTADLGDYNPKDKMKKLAADWKALSDPAKKKYLDANRAARELREREDAAVAKPKGPLSAYMVFCRENRPAKGSGGSITEEMKKLASKWRALSDSSKAAYTKMAADDKERYKKELAAWGQKVGQEHVALVELQQQQKLHNRARKRLDKKRVALGV
jgi:hypothetical protein